jgi:hypothetical protein
MTGMTAKLAMSPSDETASSIPLPNVPTWKCLVAMRTAKVAISILQNAEWHRPDHLDPEGARRHRRFRCGRFRHGRFALMLR